MRMRRPPTDLGPLLLKAGVDDPVQAVGAVPRPLFGGDVRPRNDAQPRHGGPPVRPRRGAPAIHAAAAAGRLAACEPGHKRGRASSAGLSARSSGQRHGDWDGV